jgi:hypothetical protein
MNMKTMPTVSLARSISLALGAAFLLVASAPQASAQSIQLDLNNGRIGIAPDAPPPPGRYRRAPGGFEGARISCGEGRRIVRSNGFRNVRPVECNGRAFTYLGQRRGEAYEVRISALDGRILGIEAY